jgi:hypothetical protein
MGDLEYSNNVWLKQLPMAKKLRLNKKIKWNDKIDIAKDEGDYFKEQKNESSINKDICKKGIAFWNEEVKYYRKTEKEAIEILESGDYESLTNAQLIRYLYVYDICLPQNTKRTIIISSVIKGLKK